MSDHRKECPYCHKKNTVRVYKGLKTEVWACKRCANPSYRFPYKHTEFLPDRNPDPNHFKKWLDERN